MRIALALTALALLASGQVACSTTPQPVTPPPANTLATLTTATQAATATCTHYAASLTTAAGNQHLSYCLTVLGPARSAIAQAKLATTAAPIACAAKASAASFTLVQNYYAKNNIAPPPELVAGLIVAQAVGPTAPASCDAQYPTQSNTLVETGIPLCPPMQGGGPTAAAHPCQWVTK